MTDSSPLLQPFHLGDLELPHRIVMAPMTRHRVDEAKAPGALAVEYYRQRSSAALIITEWTDVDPDSIGGRPTRPAIVTEAQVAGWRQVTDAVHAEGGRIFLQLSHLGRAALPEQLRGGRAPRGPSAILPAAMHYTAAGPIPYVLPGELSLTQIREVVQQFGAAAKRARDAGFDGVEIQAANGYLIDQFLRDGSNRRTDAYGGSVDGRFSLLAEVIEATLDVWPSGRIGVRLSPTNPFQDMSDSDPLPHFSHIAERLNSYRLAYLHVVEPPEQKTGRPEVARHLRAAFDGPFIAAEGFARETGEEWLRSGRADLIAYGKHFVANPDLVERWRHGAALNPADKATFYTTGAEGYIDYPTLAETAAAAE